MRRNLILGMAIVLIAAIAFSPLLPSRSVEDISINEVLFQRQSVAGNYHYRKSVRQTLRGDAEALTILVHADCGGGAGCYEHGEVLASVLIRLGEADFIRMVGNLKKEDRVTLKSLLDVGFEYGRFTKKQPIEWERDYPKLMYMLEKS